ncbi:MAG: hypothetical protein ACI9FU_001282 [Granulosicoccus sp.]|jgi:hypothetical protein
MRLILLVVMFCFVLIGCAKTNGVSGPSGIKGMVYQRIANCDESTIQNGDPNQTYNGFLYFIDKSEFDAHLTLNGYSLESPQTQLVNLLFAHAKGHAISVWVGHGQLNSEVVPGIYYAVTRDVLDLNHIVAIDSGLMIEQDLEFMICESHNP